jgi:hypothetical protein
MVQDNVISVPAGYLETHCAGVRASWRIRIVAVVCEIAHDNIVRGDEYDRALLIRAANYDSRMYLKFVDTRSLMISHSRIGRRSAL